MQVHCGTCSDCSWGFLRVGCIDRADDIEAVYGLAIDWTQVSVPGWPADGTLVWDPGRSCRVESRIFLVVDSQSIDPTVSGHRSNTTGDSQEGVEGLHVFLREIGAENAFGRSKLGIAQLSYGPDTSIIARAGKDGTVLRQSR